MGRVLTRMNTTSLFIAVIQDEAEKRRTGIIGSILLVLFCVGMMFLIYKFPPQDPPVEQKTDENKLTSSGSPVENFFAGCFATLFAGAAFVALIAVCLFVIVKAVKFVWFF